MSTPDDVDLRRRHVRRVPVPRRRGDNPRKPDMLFATPATPAVALRAPRGA
ncbi:hypothetical protein [Bounagaea algeriensis]